MCVIGAVMRHMPPLLILSHADDVYSLFLQRALRVAGYGIELVGDDLAAYSAACAKQPDGLVIDISAQGPHTALSLLNLLRLDPRTASIPVLLCGVSTPLLTENVAYFGTMHCVVLIKPFARDTLLDAIRQMLEPSRPM